MELKNSVEGFDSRLGAVRKKVQQTQKWDSGIYPIKGAKRRKYKRVQVA